MKRGADLFNPDSIKAVIASQTWSNSTRVQMIAAYKKFAVLNRIKWTPPKYEVIRKLPSFRWKRRLTNLSLALAKR